LETENK